MSAPRTVTVVCRGTPAGRRLWYGELARLLASAAPPAVVLVEVASDRPLPCVTVRPAEVVELLEESAAGRSVRVERSRLAAPEPPRHLPFGAWVWVTRTGDGRPPLSTDGRPGIDRVGVAPGADGRFWLGLQTFWAPAPRGGLYLARRCWVAARDRAEGEEGTRAAGCRLAAQWSLLTGVPSTFAPGRFGSRGDWREGAFRTAPPEAWFERTAEVAARSVRPIEGPGSGEPDRPVETPAIVLGASGSGKTTYLARWAALAARGGGALFALDLHGDLAPAILARLSPEGRRRAVAVDASLPPVPGVAALVVEGSRDRASAQLVAALKRLSPDGTDLYWGFRLERVFDTFVRLALESGGTLTDLYDLLTSADRRDAARLATRSNELARFLDELAPVVHRNPEFLWSAATRLSKVVLVPALRELLAPEDGGVPVEQVLEEGRPLLVRLPFATLGPEAAGFAATLVLGRVYLGLAAAAERRGRPVPVAVVLDEVQSFSPRLVAEILTEGRKFGLCTIVATQYPDRLAPELASAARGALRGYVTFRVPRPAAAEVGAWLGLAPHDAQELLPNLPTGEGVGRDSGSEDVRPIAPEEDAFPAGGAWRAAVDATRGEFGGTAPAGEEAPGRDLASERILLAVLSATEARAPIDRETVLVAARTLPGRSPDGAILFDRLPKLLRDGYLEENAGRLSLTAAGERWLGLTAPTGAVRETAEHRALLMAAFRAFARRGYRLEILRQGRFDTTLPDARFRQLPVRNTSIVPAELADEVERARSGWAWRFFRGRDVYVEAEVSGALRPERVRHGVRKAQRRGAFVVFVVGDGRRARRVREVVRAMGLGVGEAQVWTLRLPTVSPDRARGTNT